MKLFKTLTVAVLLVALICCPLRASAISADAVVTDFKQQQIDAIHTELNELAAEERMLSFMSESEASTLSADYAAQLEAINSQEKALTDRLEVLGVHTVDPNNPEDIARLEEIVMGNTNSTANLPDLPGVDNLADWYTVTQHGGTTYVNGVEYNYAFIYVTDNKGTAHSPLTVSKTATLIGQESTALWDLIDYPFSFSFSSYLGTIPSGWTGSWTIGSAFPALNSLNQSAPISSSGDDIYRMTIRSVTQMLYCYVYFPNGGWVQCGVHASNISYYRTEYFLANIGGIPYGFDKSYPTVTSSTGNSAVSYVTNYISNNDFGLYQIGTFSVNSATGNSVVFEPGFAQYPYHLMW